MDNKIIQGLYSALSSQLSRGHFHHLSPLKGGTPAAESPVFSFVLVAGIAFDCAAEFQTIIKKSLQPQMGHCEPMLHPEWFS